MGSTAAPLVAVEDDEIEFVELLVEEFARRKGDEREFADGRAVLLFRRTQNGEMDEIDGGIGFQQVAPGALAGMRLARDEQHAQPVAHAVRDDNGAVVQDSQFVGPFLDVDLDDVGPAMGEGERHFRRFADGGTRRRDLFAIDCDGDVCRLACLLVSGGGFVDAEGKIDGLADDAEARRFGDAEPPVLLALAADDEPVHRRIEAERVRRLRYVMDLPVGDHDRARDAFARDIGERFLQRGEESGALFVLGIVHGGHDARLDAVLTREPLGDPGQCGGGLVGPCANLLALAPVDNNGRDIGHRLAVFLPHGRIEQREHENGKCRRSPGRAASAPPCRIGKRGNAGNGKRRDQQHRKQRFEDDIPGHRVRPTARGARGAPGREPDPTCSCRSAHR